MVLFTCELRVRWLYFLSCRIMISVPFCPMIIIVGRSIVTKKGDGSQVKESTDSSTTLEDDDIKGKFETTHYHSPSSIFVPYNNLWWNGVLVKVFSLRVHLSIAQLSFKAKKKKPVKSYINTLELETQTLLSNNKIVAWPIKSSLKRFFIILFEISVVRFALLITW